MSRLKGKVAVVTGGAEGIGKATCERFAREGASVVLADINEMLGRQTAAAVTADAGRCLFVHTDVSDESSVKRMVGETVKVFGRIDILVNNAAIFVLRGIDATVEEWHRILDVNVIGASLATKHVVPEMRKAGGGT